MKLEIGAVTKGGTSLKYKTGNWRDQRPVIDEGNCRHCGICAEVCPDSAVHAIERAGTDKAIYIIDYDYCKGCGLCAYECPVKCIEMVPEEK
jgi:pyruvate ferredoxin oxidoreductase delta subunit